MDRIWKRGSTLLWSRGRECGAESRGGMIKDGVMWLELPPWCTALQPLVP